LSVEHSAELLHESSRSSSDSSAASALASALASARAPSGAASAAASALDPCGASPNVEHAEDAPRTSSHVHRGAVTRTILAEEVLQLVHEPLALRGDLLLQLLRQLLEQLSLARGELR